MQLDVTATVQLYEVRCDVCNKDLDFKAEVDVDGDICATVERCDCGDDE
ncbi:hypothetical protein GCM10007160_18120 [Litchfieldella qijiaojingensis]|uniref:Uncharacterized protein n=1 Tax=Litchfieldella qijiaojingensis TaxID=980347 RepID=A0ABQ2YRM7_9GAMM|nr:hypothetical protein [Halomonas qijiaojingensis]GGX91026.1 hypothetical protein GCM10007160_18120 [Halomonas qijiaojingensis]